MYKSDGIASVPATDDLNFLRFLTASLSMSPEDALLVPLFRPLTVRQLHTHFAAFNAQGYLSSAAKKMHLYIHVPFCATICSFCHCHHLEVKNGRQLRNYVDFVIKQIYEFSPLFDKTLFGSFTVLGGTASLLNASEIKLIFETVTDKFRFHPQVQFNFEGHPSSLSNEKLDVLKECGVGKIHLGVQSLDEEVLKKINRYQTRESVERCIQNIQKRGFTCINVDLVAGLPGQTTAGFLDDIKTLVGWGVDLFNINPFSDILSMPCSNDVSESLQEVLNGRHEMIGQAKAMLESYGYANKGQRGYLKGAAGESLKFEPEMYPGGVLGLGLLAKSNLPGELAFETRLQGNDYSTARYDGCPIDKRYSMAQYAQVHLLYGLETKAFKGIFGEEFISIFREEVRDLLEQGILSKSNGTYRYAGPKTLKGLFDYFSGIKILLGDKMISEFREAYVPKYNPAKNYGTNEDLLKVFQDMGFAREYYQVGQKTLWL
jgi:coproporphyrinogen III oxidase-like Fe-S oxidoreductase